ncbi:MAG: PPC domain-containing protein [Anaerolineales bacterium]|nr:PPC domain-containing protein [Anaerolineales bacterium]
MIANETPLGWVGLGFLAAVVLIGILFGLRLLIQRKRLRTSKTETSPDVEKPKKPALKPLLKWAGLGVLGIVVLFGIYFGARFLADLTDLPLALPDLSLGPRFPVEDLGVRQEMQASFSAAGGRATLGELMVEVPPGLVSGEAVINIASLDPKSLPKKPPKEVRGEIYSIEWASAPLMAALSSTPIPLTFSYDPERLPSREAAEKLAVYTFDGADWLRLPSQVDTRKHTITANVSHFSLFSWGLSRLAPDYTAGPIRFLGRVMFTDGRYPGYPGAELVPAEYMKFAIHDMDNIILHEGYLEPDGSFEFTLPEGTDVGFRVNVYLRVYSANPFILVGERSAALGGAYSVKSDLMNYDIGHTPSMINFGTIKISHEDSGPFRILKSVSAAVATFQQYYPAFSPSHFVVVWGGPAHRRVFKTDTGFSNGVIYIGNDPQAAYDDDVIMQAFGEYALYWLYDQETLNCDGGRAKPNQTSDPCSAWQAGWSYFFSSLLQQDAVFEAYQNKSKPRVQYDLEDEAFPPGERSTGAVMQTLWEFTEEGKNTDIIQRIFEVLKSNGASIDSITRFYDAWDAEYGFTEKECRPFVSHEITEERLCGTAPASASGIPAAPVMPAAAETSPATAALPNYESIAIGSITGAVLHAGEKDYYVFGGSAGDHITINLYSEDAGFDPNLTLQALDGAALSYDDDGGGNRNARIENFTLGFSGPYGIVVGATSGSGAYTLDLQYSAAPTAEPTLEATGTALPEAQSLYYGQQTYGYIDPGEKEIWTFDGGAGDVITITLVADTESFDPVLDLYDSTYVLLANNDDAYIPDHWSRDARIEGFSLTYSGRYYVEVESIHSDTGGSYYLLLERAEAGSPLTPASTAVQPACGVPSDWAPFTFHNNTGYSIQYLVMGTTGRELYSFEYQVVGTTFYDTFSTHLKDTLCSYHDSFLEPGESLTVLAPPGTFDAAWEFEADLSADSFDVRCPAGASAYGTYSCFSTSSGSFALYSP